MNCTPGWPHTAYRAVSQSAAVVHAYSDDAGDDVDGTDVLL